MFWKTKTPQEKLAEELMNKLEIKKALEVIKEGIKDKYDNGLSYKKQDEHYYYFDLPGYTTSYTIDKNFTIITRYVNLGIEDIIDLSTKNLKIQEEFKDLFEGLKLQQEGFMKMRGFMKESLVELYNKN